MRLIHLLFLLSCTATAPASGEWRFTEECDASAVVAMDGALYVGVDEGTALIAYPLPKSRETNLTPIQRIDLTERLEWAMERPLDTKKGVPQELDLEAAARSGDQVWWLGSHGRSKDGEERINRRMLFATSLPIAAKASKRGDRRFKIAVPPYDLLPDILALPTLGPIVSDVELRSVPPKQGGLNLEGLAVDPKTNDLLIGLRSPLTADKRAWILRRSAAGRLREHATLDLGGLGIRSITWSRHVNGFVIAAGPSGPGGPFRLYRWDGRDTVTPISVDLGALRPEALTDVQGGLLLLSDDGGVRREDRDCKDRRARDAKDPLVYFSGRIIPAVDLKR